MPLASVRMVKMSTRNSGFLVQTYPALSTGFAGWRSMTPCRLQSLKAHVPGADFVPVFENPQGRTALEVRGHFIKVWKKHFKASEASEPEGDPVNDQNERTVPTVSPAARRWVERRRWAASGTLDDARPDPSSFSLFACPNDRFEGGAAAVEGSAVKPPAAAAAVEGSADDTCRYMQFCKYAF